VQLVATDTLALEITQKISRVAERTLELALRREPALARMPLDVAALIRAVEDLAQAAEGLVADLEATPERPVPAEPEEHAGESIDPVEGLGNALIYLADRLRSVDVPERIMSPIERLLPDEARKLRGELARVVHDAGPVREWGEDLVDRAIVLRAQQEAKSGALVRAADERADQRARAGAPKATLDGLIGVVHLGGDAVEDCRRVWGG